MARTNNLSNFLTDVADAIRTKKGSEEPIAAADFDTEIENLPSGGETQEAPDNDVIFYDYDGTKLLSYTAEEFLALEEMPSLPTTVNHPGLIPQGWNWHLEEAQVYVGENGALDIAQTYNADVALRVFVEIDEAHKNPYLGITFNGVATIDWGDGTESQEVQSDGNNRVDTQHIYQNIGNYTIEVTTDAAIKIEGDRSYGQKLFTKDPTTANVNKGYARCVRKIELGENSYVGICGCKYLANLETINLSTTYGKMYETFTDWAFEECTGLRFIACPYRTTFESGVRTGVKQKCLENCYNLKAISFPYGLCFIPSTGGLSNCISLKRIIIPSTIDGTTSLGYFAGANAAKQIVLPKILKKHNGQEVTNLNLTINASMFSANYSLLKLFIPKKVNTIGANAFANCVSCQYYDFSEHTSVPTLANKNAFTGIPDDCKIIVPDDLYEDWIAATNWSNLASYIIKKSDWDALQNA